MFCDCFQAFYRPPWYAFVVACKVILKRSNEVSQLAIDGLLPPQALCFDGLCEAGFK